MQLGDLMSQRSNSTVLMICQTLQPTRCQTAKCKLVVRVACGWLCFPASAAAAFNLPLSTVSYLQQAVVRHIALFSSTL
jgi:hypothetical protein